MANTTLIQSDWSTISNIQCGYLIDIKAKRESLTGLNVTTDIENATLIIVDDELYARYTNNSGYLSLAKYNKVNNTWTIINESTILNIDSCQVVGFNNNIYFMYNNDSDEVILKIYNTVNNSWTDGIINDTLCIFSTYEVDLSYYRKFISEGVYEDSLYIFGRANHSVTYNTLPLFLKYDLTSKTWSSIDLSEKVIDTSCPGSLAYPKLNKYNDNFYIVGIRNETTHSLWSYEILTNTFSKKNDLSMGENSAFLMLVQKDNDMIGILEEYDIDTEKSKYYFKTYNTTNDTWGILNNIPGIKENDFYYLAMDKNSIYLLNYQYENILKPSINSVEQYFVSNDILLDTTNVWYNNGYLYLLSEENSTIILKTINLTTNAITTDNITFPVGNAVNNLYTAMTFYNNAIYFYGGVNTNKIYKYDISTKSCTLVNDTGKNKQRSSIIIVNDKLYSIGGSNLTDIDYYDTLDVYDLVNNTWNTITIPNTDIVKRTYCKLFSKDNNVFIYYGESNDVSSSNLNKIWVFDTSTNTFTEKGEIPQINNKSIFFIFNNQIYCTETYFTDINLTIIKSWDYVTDTYTTYKTILFNSSFGNNIQCYYLFEHNSNLMNYCNINVPVAVAKDEYIDNQIIQYDLTALTYSSVIGEKFVESVEVEVDPISVSYVLEENDKIFFSLYYSNDPEVEFDYFGDSSTTYILDNFYYLWDIEFTNLPLGFTFSNNLYWKIKCFTNKCDTSEFSLPFKKPV